LIVRISIVFCNIAYYARALYKINYFDNPTKLFSDLYLTKFLDTSVKSVNSVNYVKK